VPDIRAGDEREAAPSVDVIRAVLGIVFDDEDQGGTGRAAVRDSIDDEANGVIIVRHLGLDRVHAINRLVEIAKMIVTETQQR
jgi:hypothetical protein